MADGEIDGTIALDPNPKPVEDNPPPEPEDELEGEPAPDDDEAPVDEETIDFEDGGKKFKVPKALKDYLLRHSDYSKKTAEVAERRKALEAELEKLPTFRQAEETYRQQVGELHYLDKQLSAFEKVNFPAWLSSPDANERARAQAAFAQKGLLQDQRNKLAGSIKEADAKHESARAGKIQERLRATQEFAEKEIPGWSAERNKAIGDLIAGQTLSPGGAKLLYENMEPGFLKILDLALDGHRYREARAKATKAKETAEAATVTPLVRVAARKGAASSAPRDSEPIETWMRKRNQQTANAR